MFFIPHILEPRRVIGEGSPSESGDEKVSAVTSLPG